MAVFEETGVDPLGDFFLVFADDDDAVDVADNDTTDE